MSSSWCRLGTEQTTLKLIVIYYIFGTYCVQGIGFCLRSWGESGMGCKGPPPGMAEKASQVRAHLNCILKEKETLVREELFQKGRIL